MHFIPLQALKNLLPLELTLQVKPFCPWGGGNFSTAHKFLHPRPFKMASKYLSDLLSPASWFALLDWLDRGFERVPYYSSLFRIQLNTRTAFVREIHWCPKNDSLGEWVSKLSWYCAVSEPYTWYQRFYLGGGVVWKEFTFFGIQQDGDNLHVIQFIREFSWTKIVHLWYQISWMLYLAQWQWFALKAKGLYILMLGFLIHQ
jgi:hypothetical protein